jgi:hypothetical protein
MEKQFPLSDADINVSRLAFIVGHYKSGSTWLINLLSAHPEIRGVAETHVFRYAFHPNGLDFCTDTLFRKVAWSEGGIRKLPRRRAADFARAMGLRRSSAQHKESRPTTLLDLSIRKQWRLRSLLRLIDSPDEYCRCFFSFLDATFSPAKYLIEKTPTNIFEVPKISSIFPAAKLIAIHRDGRDVVVSDRYFRQMEARRSVHLRESISRWKEAMEAECRWTQMANFFSLSYESLKAAPKETVRALLNWLQIKSNDQVIDEMIRCSSFEAVTGRSAGVEDPNSFYRKGVSGDWKNHFTDQDRQLFSQIAGDLLVQMGYAMTADWTAWERPTANQQMQPTAVDT